MPETVLNAVDLLTFTADVDDNAASVVTLAAVADRRNIVRHVIASYDIPPAAGDRTLTIAFTQGGTAKTAEVAVSSSTATILGINLPFDEGEIVGDVNTAITITLAASGTAGNRGHLNVWSRN
jgi:hypothetical protein